MNGAKSIKHIWRQGGSKTLFGLKKKSGQNGGDWKENQKFSPWVKKQMCKWVFTKVGFMSGGGEGGGILKSVSRIEDWGKKKKKKNNTKKKGRQKRTNKTKNKNKEPE